MDTIKLGNDIMSREEIREQIAKIAGNNPNPKEVDLETADIVLVYLHSQGVVIKVDRELPVVKLRNRFMQDVVNETLKKLSQDGYVAVEPLIEKKDELPWWDRPGVTVMDGNIK